MTKILIAEDELDVRTNLVDLLTHEGFSVRAAADGEECIEMALAEPPDLLVCDLVMPRMDGYQVVNRIRSEDFTVDIPIIFLTARGARTDYRLAMEAGADDYITKPFHAEELIGAIQSRIRRVEKQRRYFLESMNLFGTLSGPNSLQEAMQNAYSVSNFSSMLSSYSASLGRASVQQISREIQDSANRLSSLLEDFAVNSCVEAQSTGLLNPLSEQPDLINFDRFASTLRNFAMQWGRASDLDIARLHGAVAIPEVLLKKLFENILEAVFLISLPGSPIRIGVLHNAPLTIGWNWQPPAMPVAHSGLSLGQAKLNYASKIATLINIQLTGNLQSGQLELVLTPGKHA